MSADDLRRVGDATELELASRRSDGTLTPYTTMWVVRVGNDLYVVFGEAPADAHTAIDDAYHSKYDRYGPDPVSHVTGPNAHAVTIRLVRSEP